jgi:hypothetical protein
VLPLAEAGADGTAGRAERGWAVELALAGGWMASALLMDLAGASDSGLDGTTLTKLAISPARRQLVKGVHELTDTDTVHPAGIFQEFLGVRAALGRMMICAAPAIKYSILIPMRSGLRLQQPQATNTIIDTNRGQQQQVNARQEAKSKNRY